MKRMLAAAITGTMLLTAGLQVYAAPSVQGGGAQQGNIPAQQVVGAATEEGQSVSDLADGVAVEPLEDGAVVWGDIDRTKYTEEELAVLDSLNAATQDMSVLEAFGDLVDLTEAQVFGADGEQVEIEDTEAFFDELKFLSPVWELAFDGVEPTKENPVLCTFTVNNLTDDMEVYMLYQCEEDGWELLATEKVADNQVEVAIHSASAPAALVYRIAEPDEQAEGTSPVAGEAQTEAASEMETELN